MERLCDFNECFGPVQMLNSQYITENVVCKEVL